MSLINQTGIDSSRDGPLRVAWTLLRYRGRGEARGTARRQSDVGKREEGSQPARCQRFSNYFRECEAPEFRIVFYYVSESPAEPIIILRVIKDSR